MVEFGFKVMASTVLWCVGVGSRDDLDDEHGYFRCAFSVLLPGSAEPPMRPSRLSGCLSGFFPKPQTPNPKPQTPNPKPYLQSPVQPFFGYLCLCAWI